MDSDREQHAGQIPLPGGEAEVGYQPAATRRDSVRHARRMSNWTLAALIAGTGAATVALAHHAFSSVATTVGAPTTAATGGQAAVNGTSGPQVSHSVATTSGSGATVTTTTKTVNGKTVIVRTVHPAAYHDD
ncbi:MAG TPA: hypothetical protein VIX86_19530 [Streptosporangiaceae bacterium]